ncbi:MAG: MotA/TolQ/ExbB proton channel family protein [Bacteroidetes bacterium]|nr:MotA/TolQ/ExbB proton channel family protein [Bacteroidota bacterium]
MKRLFALLVLAGILTFTNSSIVVAQDDATDTEQTADTTAFFEAADAGQPVEFAEEEEAVAEEDPFATTTGEELNFHQQIKEKFIEGGWAFMGIVLLCLIIGLAISIERIIVLNLSTTSTRKLLANVEDALNQGGVDGAMEVTKNTKGPVASIFTQGLLRMTEGIEMVEKSIIAYGSVEMGRLEKGLVWISLFISLAPMLGFMGTVIGMIGAFDAIEAAGDISPQIVARGIKVALLTTVAGLIVGVILQLFYNYLVSKIDAMVNDMEDASISLVDMLVQHKLSK